MKRYTNLLFLLVCIQLLWSQKTSYQLDLKNSVKTDLYSVRVHPEKLHSNSVIFNFVAVTPGTYKTQDFGRFVSDFKAIGRDGKLLHTKKISVNSWKISNALQLDYLEYQIEDSYDFADQSNPLFPMSGTSIDSDYILVNSFGVFGYFEQLQFNPIELKIEAPVNWAIETALSKDKMNLYQAASFNEFADFPILIGKKLKKVVLNEDQIKIDVVVYSSNDSISVQRVADFAKEVHEAAMDFISFSPVNQYSFLMCFFDQATVKRNNFFGFGALEHSYSSFYAFPEDNTILTSLKSTMAHEFFHIVTPLTIHSEIIEKFNFTKPVASEHLWLYEGVTDWAADMMLLRSKQIELQDYLNLVSSNITTDQDFYDSSYSLSKIALECYDPVSRKQYGNIYARGNFNAVLMDIRLLKLTNGEMGLRELIINLSKKYGKKRSFPEDRFFDVIAEMSHPQIREYIDRYIRGTDSYPFAEYFKWLGINYIPSRKSKNETPVIGISFGQNNENQITIGGFSKNHQPFGLMKGDIISSLFGKTVDLSSLRSVLGEISKYKAGDSYEIIVMRDNNELKFTGHFLQRMDYHVLEPDPNANAEQLKFRDIWLNYIKVN